MDNSSLMNRENKKRQLRRQIVPPRYQTEEESEQAIRNAHKKTVRKRLAVLAVVAVLLGGAAFGIYYYDRYHSFYDYQVVWEKSLAEENQDAGLSLWEMEHGSVQEQPSVIMFLSVPTA